MLFVSKEKEHRAPIWSFGQWQLRRPFLKDDVRCKPELDGLGALGDLVRPICLFLPLHVISDAGRCSCKLIACSLFSACAGGC